MSGTATALIVAAVFIIYGSYLAYAVVKLRQRDPEPGERDVS